eukprot:scaffold11958_cov72-Phaeocystis_antarctica.AAC.2
MLLYHPTNYVTKKRDWYLSQAHQWPQAAECRSCYSTSVCLRCTDPPRARTPPPNTQPLGAHTTLVLLADQRLAARTQRPRSVLLPSAMPWPTEPRSHPLPTRPC